METNQEVRNAYMRKWKRNNKDKVTYMRGQ